MIGDHPEHRSRESANPLPALGLVRMTDQATRDETRRGPEHASKRCAFAAAAAIAGLGRKKKDSWMIYAGPFRPDRSAQGRTGRRAD